MILLSDLLFNQIDVRVASHDSSLPASIHSECMCNELVKDTDSVQPSEIHKPAGCIIF